MLHKLARDLELPKLTFQVIRRTIATLVQMQGTVKDVQGVLRHSRTATDVYRQEIPGQRAGDGEFDPSRVEDEVQAFNSGGSESVGGKAQSASRDFLTR